MECAELEEMLSNRTEGLIVEYKREISDPYKFAKAAAAIANANGGRIFVGVEEDPAGKPILRGVKYDRSTHNKERIANILSDRIRPRMPGVEIEFVAAKERGSIVFVVSIPPSSLVHGVKTGDGLGSKPIIRSSISLHATTPTKSSSRGSLTTQTT